MEKYAHCGGFLEGATVDARGGLWVVDLLSGKVLEVGSNGSCTIGFVCNAAPGYDGPTGLGSPNGNLAPF